MEQHRPSEIPPKKIRLYQLDVPTLAPLSILSRDELSGLLHDVGVIFSAGASTWQHKSYSSASASSTNQTKTSSSATTTTTTATATSAGNTGNIDRKGKKKAVDFVVATGASPGVNSKASHKRQKVVYECRFETCGKPFKTQALLETHVKKVHPGQKPYICGLAGCQTLFSNWAQVQQETWASKFLQDPKQLLLNVVF